MRTVFHARPVNPPFGDPAVYVELADEKRAMLFDCGELTGMSPREILRVSDLFVSHTHMDHWVGFDRVLRVCVGRDKSLRLFGPAGFIEQVSCKARAYTWNLVDRFDAVFRMVVVELHEGGAVRLARLSSDGGFVPDAVVESECPDGVLLDEPRLEVRATVLDHRTPCLAYCLSEKGHIGVRKNDVEGLGLRVGPWLQELKRAVRAGVPGDTVFRAWWQEKDGTLVERFVPMRSLLACLQFSPGQRLGYVVDARFDERNCARIVSLVEGADVLFIETPFLHREADHAFERYHLTAHQAGLLARRAGVGRIVPFHFSPRHENEADALRAESQHAFEHGSLRPGA